MERARLRTGALADALGWATVEAPSVAKVGPPSTWPPIDERLSELRAHWSHDVLIANRGGYGCIHLADLLTELPAPAPYLIGYSDLTSFHAAWWVHGWGETCYGFMPATPGESRSNASTLALLRGHSVQWDQHTDPLVGAVQPGSAHGPAFAGCLRVLTSLCGTALQPDLHGCIVALEDIDERPYAIDRDLEQCARAGLFDGIAGLVLGCFRHEPRAGYAGPTVLDLAHSWSRRLNVPTIVQFPFGHEADAPSIACGRPSTLTVHADGSWSFTQAKLERSPVRE